MSSRRQLTLHDRSHGRRRHREGTHLPRPKPVGSTSAAAFEVRLLSISTLLAVRLQTVFDRRDLTKRDLVAANRYAEHRNVKPQQYWEDVARPRAARLQREAVAAIDAELDQVDRSLEVLLRGNKPIDLGTRNRLVTSLELVARAMPSPAGINNLGAWWQRRLRRAAVVHNLIEIAVAPPSQTGLIIDRSELEMSGSTPWACSDRLLAAFELAHGAIRQHHYERVASLLLVLDPDTRSGRPSTFEKE